MPYGLIVGSEEGFCNLCLFAGKFQDSALNWTTVSTSIELATVKAHVCQTHCQEKKHADNHTPYFNLEIIFAKNN
jgi:hypothetical protein